VLVSSDSVHRTTGENRDLKFSVRVYDYESTDSFDDTCYLGLGDYRMHVYGDGSLWGSVGSVDVEGDSGSYVNFFVYGAGDFDVQGISYDDGGQIRVVIDKLL